MEEELESIKAMLAEHGGADRVVAIERYARTHMPPLDRREEMALLLNELEGILVEAPKMVMTTMHMLGADTIRFSKHPDADGRAIFEQPTDGEDIKISAETLERWGEHAAHAYKVIAELRRIYDIRPDSA